MREMVLTNQAIGLLFSKGKVIIDNYNKMKLLFNKKRKLFQASFFVYQSNYTMNLVGCQQGIVLTVKLCKIRYNRSN